LVSFKIELVGLIKALGLLQLGVQVSALFVASQVVTPTKVH